MRALVPLAALAAFAFAQSAAAATVTLSPVTLSEDFQTTLQEDYGEREGIYLQKEVTESVSRALTRAGAQLAPGGDLVLDVAIIDAKPNHPTLQQLSDTPSLDMMRSISIGGAELRGVLRRSSGEVLAEIDHEYNSPTLDYVHSAGQWHDAYRAINGFAREVAEAYAANAR